MTPQPTEQERAFTELERIVILDNRTVQLLEEIAGYLKRIASKVDPQ